MRDRYLPAGADRQGGLQLAQKEALSPFTFHVHAASPRICETKAQQDHTIESSTFKNETIRSPDFSQLMQEEVMAHVCTSGELIICSLVRVFFVSSLEIMNLRRMYVEHRGQYSRVAWSRQRHNREKSNNVERPNK